MKYDFIYKYNKNLYVIKQISDKIISDEIMKKITPSKNPDLIYYHDEKNDPHSDLEMLTEWIRLSSNCENIFYFDEKVRDSVVSYN